jgi:trimethylamine--corrinoid protein Co-methyltransferase
MPRFEATATNAPRAGRKGSRRAGSGRAARLRKRASKSASSAVWPGVTAGQYQPLTVDDITRVHHGALAILANTGVADATRELLDIALPQGCKLNEHGRLCFPASLMEDLLAASAKEYVVYARGERAGKDDIYCNGTKVHFSTAGSAVTTFQAESRTYRASTILDIYDFTRLTDTLEHIHMIGDTVVPTDVPDDFEHDINIAYALTAATEKNHYVCRFAAASTLNQE